MLLPKIWIICRVCLKQHDVMCDIYTEIISTYSIWQLLRDCGGVPVRENDNLPDKICLECCKKLWKCNKFRLQCQRGHREITQMLLERDHNIHEQELELERQACSDVDKPSEKVNDDLIKPIEQNIDQPQISITTTSNVECHETLKPSVNSEKVSDTFIEPIERIEDLPATVICTTYQIIETIEQNENQPETLICTSNVECHETLNTSANSEFLYLKEDVPIETDTNDIIKPEETETIEIENVDIRNYSQETKTIEIANGNIKHYCVVKNESLENDKQDRIVLLLKLKNDTKNTQIKSTKTKKTNTKANKINKKPNRTIMKGNKTNSKTKRMSKPNIKIKIIPKSKRKTISNTQTKKKKLSNTQKSHRCKTCAKEFKTRDLLRHHNCGGHTKTHLCKICGKSFRQVQAYINHYNTHTGEKPYLCRFCCIQFNDVTNRNTHERNKHKNKEFICEKCGKKFRFLTLLERHSNVHKDKICSICGKEYSTLQVLRRHHQQIHLKEDKVKVVKSRS